MGYHKFSLFMMQIYDGIYLDGQKTEIYYLRWLREKNFVSIEYNQLTQTSQNNLHPA